MSAPATLTIPEAAELLGVGRNLAYEAVARDGQLAGITAIKVGRRRVIPRAPFLEALGITDTTTADPPKGRPAGIGESTISEQEITRQEVRREP